MALVIVIARVRPRAETRAEFLALLEEVQAASRSDEGCLHYGYYAEIADTDSFVAVEEWRDMAALESHLAQPHVHKLIAALPRMLDGRPEIVAHEVTRSGPLPAPRAAS